MVKSELPEPQFPAVQRYARRLQRLYGGVSGTRRSATSRRKSSPGEQCPMRAFKGTNEAPVLALNVQLQWNSGWPTGREPYGHRALIVVRGWESQPHGEGGQVFRRL